MNTYSIGIEINNKGDGVDPFPDIQVQAVAWLCAKKSKAFGITEDWITDHRTVNTVDHKIDMMPNWPWKKFFAYYRDFGGK